MPHGLDELVGRQFQRWERGRRSGAGEALRPCIAISRLRGSGAGELGQRLAERLGYTFFGSELVDHIAQQAGLRRELVAGVDEHVRSSIDRYVADGMRREHFTEGDYARHLLRAVGALAERGAAVVLGRGSVFIVPPERALRILVVAPREERVARLAEREGLGTEEAARRLDALDEERRAFLTHHFRGEPDAPERVDVCLNTGTLGLGGAFEVALAALRARFGEKAVAPA
jgi:cytidylate kinase